MWQNIVNTAKSTTAFLQNGVAPPNTPTELRTKMENTNHLSSKKFFIIFTSVLMLAALYYSSVAILLSINMPEHVTAFVTLFSKTIEIFAIIIASYLGVQAAVDLKYNSSSNAEVKGEIEVIKEEITQHIIEQGSENAPEIRPYSTIATEEK
ncbi:hypothetical protein UFOVP760_121 [uncultured Caudovirales phage]|uniref:Uncharacterized protein n=1 Tax=uncultured Caudovirales phage TaxID=2100421 RepID=A0A6J7XEQ2_9CAUD|nr:hypothetical protein UFOVP760_121 [uncultured Caudovirales phage]